MILAFLVPTLAFSQMATYKMAAYDTLTDADTGIYAYPKVISGLYGYSVQGVSTKISGSNGTTVAYLQGSIDNTNWTDLDTILSTSNASGGGIDTETTGELWPYLRIYVLHTGTAVDKVLFTYVLYPRDGAMLDKSIIWAAQATYDTLTNTETGTYSYPKGLFSGVYVYQLKIVHDEISGTGTSTYTLEGSDDGTNYVTIGTYAATTDTTYSILNTTGMFYKYFRIKNTHTGTGVGRNTIYGVIQRRLY